ncbi:MAG: glycerol kinase GlpK [Sedimentisphaerales bacterium]|nr:glycerol kinase GlpK [Sedimentisphaerales bacterium]
MSGIFILAIDQGTSGTKAVVFDRTGRIVAKATEPLASSFPAPGFVEQDPAEIYRNVLASVKACLDQFRKNVSDDLSQIATCGISNQRETFCLWNVSGTPLCNAIVWQCKRCVDVCNRLKGSTTEQEVASRTGLIIDPYFSGTKLIWLYENDARIKEAIDTGQALFGTVDTWLLYKLTQGERFLTDYTNASRTLFFNIDDLCWDQELLSRFNLQGLKLPEAKPSSFSYGVSDFEGLLPQAIPIGAMIGDSHAAAFGEGCFWPGAAKATLGTGCSILLNTGAKRIASTSGMVTTICWSTTDRVDYALEGIIVTCGATINWLRDNLGLFAESRQTEAMALSVPDTNGVYLVPAFSGLGAPHWLMDLKAAIVGLTFGCDKNHVVRAALESIPYQIKDVVAAMERDSGIALQALRVDGGISANRFVMQFLADLLGTRVVNIGIEDVSALGAAYMAGLLHGIYDSIDQLAELNTAGRSFEPGREPDREKARKLHAGWSDAIRQLARR